MEEGNGRGFVDDEPLDDDSAELDPAVLESHLELVLERLEAYRKNPVPLHSAYDVLDRLSRGQ